MKFTLSDAAQLSGTRRTRDGYLVAQVRAGRTGIQHYLGSELGRPDLATVRVFRPEDEVFHADALRSFAHRPATVDHPPGAVTADNWRDVAVGMTGGEVVRDGEFVSVPLILLDTEAIQAVADGKRELSWGYDCQIEWTAGTTPSGEAYDAVQRSMRGNHLAIVDRARAGSACRIGDAPGGAQAAQAGSTPTAPGVASVAVQLDGTEVGRGLAADAFWKKARAAWADASTPSSSTDTKGPAAMADENTRAVVLDGLTIRTNDAGAEAIARLQRQISDAAAAHEAAQAETRRTIDGLQGQVAALTTTHRQAIEAKDGEIAGLRASHTAAIEAKDGEIAALRVQASDAALDQRVAQRATLIGQAKRILGDGFDPTGQSDADIRKAAVTKAIGAALTDAENKSAAFFDAAFETVVALAPARAADQRAADPLRVASVTGFVPAADAAPNQEPTAWQRNVQHLSNAWKDPDQRAGAR